MVERRETRRAVRGLTPVLALAVTLLFVDTAEAQYETWYPLQLNGSISMSARWLDTAGMERSGEKRLQVRSAWRDSRGPLVNTSRRGVDESYDRVEEQYLVNCENGISRLVERKYLLRAGVSRRDQFRNARWNARDEMSEVACRHAGMEPPQQP